MRPAVSSLRSSPRPHTAAGARLLPLTRRAVIDAPSAETSDVRVGGTYASLEIMLLQLRADNQSAKLRAQRLEAAQERRDSALQEALAKIARLEAAIEGREAAVDSAVGAAVARVEAMEEVVAGFKAATPMPGVKEAEQSMPRKPERHGTVHDALEPITYDAAFHQIGGATKLGEYAGLSAQLLAKTGDAALDAEIKKLLPRDYARRAGFSTRLVNQKYVSSLEELYEEANRAHETFDALLRELAQQTGGAALVPPIKGEVRARMKALFKYRDAEGDGVAWYRLTDLVRGTLAYADLDGLYRGLEHVITTLGGRVKELNDRYQAPMDGGYRDIQLVVDVDGHVCELQLSTEPMLRAKKTTGHRDFEVVRELKAAVAEGNLHRVINALEFGREHLGSTKGEGAAALSELLRQGDARTLMHDAAARGHADVVHAFVQHGADVDATDSRGDTALHHAVYHGHERCVWVLLDVGGASLDVENADGQTPLIKGYMMLWQRPPEAAQRAVSTLAQIAGPERISAARAVVDEQIQRMLKQSRVLVDHAADGDVERMLDELRRYADPNSKRDGVSALAAALGGGHADAVEMLLNFNAPLNSLPLRTLPAEQLALLLRLDVELPQLLELGVTATALKKAACPPER